MSPVTSYRRLLDLVGPGYVVLAFLARLPLAMSQMGSLLLVADATGSYGAGGLAAGGLAVANAVGAPIAGSLSDRHGQRRIVLAQSVLGGTGLTVLVLLAAVPADTPFLVAAAAATGLVLPQVGPLARVRWRPIIESRVDAHRARLVSAAFSYEGAADEASFVLGPALIGLGVALLDPGVALFLAAALLMGFGSAFALHPTARLAHLPAAARAGDARLISGVFVLLMFGQLLLGSLFGSVQVGNGLVATEAGQAGLAGLVHATLGVGSVIAGLAMAAVPDRVAMSTRSLLSALALVVLSAPLLLVTTPFQGALVMLFLGFAVAPYMITNFTVAEQTVPVARVGAAMTLLAAATGVGYALGAAVAGRLADTVGATAAFAVTFSSTLLALVVSVGLVVAERRGDGGAGFTRSLVTPALPERCNTQ